ncbi:DUF6069 family protein [Micromonospora sp. NPDC047707]|uniref:DUF6069 family protein n=1 Tax=Micromonospora sp. NPDC047707 TaxID=3154498 RepID=UPI0034568873
MSATARPAIAALSTTRRRGLAVAAAVAACVLIWLVGRLSGVDFTVKNPGQPEMVIGLAPVVLVSFLASLLGWGVLALLERLTRRRATVVWTVLAVLVALVSLAPVAATDATAGAKVTLGAMHLAVAAVLVALLPSRTR